MARSRRGGSSSSSGGGLFGSRKKEAPAPAPRAAPRPAPPAPAPAAHPPAPMQQQSSGGGMLSGIGSTIAQGMAFGTGSAIAHRAVGAVANSFGGDSAPAEQTQRVQQYEAGAPQIQQDQLQGPCAQDKQMFFDCLKVNRGDQQACSFLYEQLQSCQRTETTFN